MIKEVIKFQINDIEFHLQKCLNCVILLLSLFEFIMKTKFHIWNSALTKFTQDALISFVPLIPHFRIFVRTYNWNHYRRIRVNVISVRLDSWFFFPKTPKFGNLGSKVLKTNVWFEISTFETGYKQIFVKIKKLIPFGPKCLNLDVWSQNFRKQMSDLKSARL